MDLIKASTDGNLEEVKRLIEAKVDVNFQDKYGKTALVFASENGHLEVVKCLIENDANVAALGEWRLGAGRARKEDPVQAGAGVQWHARQGDTVRAGEVLFTLHTDEPDRFVRATEALAGAATITPAGHDVPAVPELVLGRVD